MSRYQATCTDNAGRENDEQQALCGAERVKRGAYGAEEDNFLRQKLLEG